MWRSKASTIAETEAEESQSPRRLFGKAPRSGGARVNENVSTKAVEARNDLDAVRTPEEQAIQRRRKKWLMAKKALSTQEAGERSEPDCSTNGSIAPNNLFLDQRQKKVVFHQFSSTPKDVMTIEREDGIPLPETDSHVVVRVQAASVTLNDCLLRRGHDFDMMNPATLPMTPGHDVVGRIISLGPDVKDFKEGDRVAALIRTGGNARYASIPASSLVRVPHTVNAAEAACMVTVYSAAYQSLKMMSPGGALFSLTGKKVLVIGGMSDIGQAVIQMCNKARADTFATAPSRRHAYIMGTLGAVPLPEDPKDWLPRVEGDMDYVFDGQNADGLESAKKAVKKGGEIVWFGYSSMLKEEMGLFGPPLKAHLQRLSSPLFQVKCVDIWDFFHKDPETYKKRLVSLFQLLKWNKLRPHVAKRVGLSDVPFAHSKLETGEVRGCVVCMPWKRVSELRIGGEKNSTDKKRIAGEKNSTDKKNNDKKHA